MIKTTLKVRITTLMVIFSILFIFVFTAIQVKNQLTVMTSYNSYRSRLGAIIVKNTLESLLKDATLREDPSSLFQIALESLGKEKVVDRISVFDPKGGIISSNDPYYAGRKELEPEDLKRVCDFSNVEVKEKWFCSYIDERLKLIDIFIPVLLEKEILYVAKITYLLGNLQMALKEIYTPITLTVIAVIIANLVLGMILSKTIIHPIKVLNLATKDISSGNLNLRVKIKTNDEIQELGETFNDMTVALQKMKERAENANPLTKLPGNNVIREEIEKRIRLNEKFVAIHGDLDNFKAYNDKYGISKGDEVIKFAAKVLQDAVKEKGNSDDFVGHEGGDDLYLLTTPDKAEVVTNYIIETFDKEIKKFYSKEDLDLGYVLEKNRQGVLVKFPIMSISLAGVSNQIRDITSYAEVTNIAVGVKEKAKQTKGSIFVLDRRTA
ncbi:MAG: diguanylate cyclase [Candidatus Omnitrophica bacterium]|nr:diguanylate cyclase [Candidatus Omnitrophota bacterium]